MKIYALPRHDGGVEIMYTDGDPQTALAKWHQKRRDEVTGETLEISADDVPQNRSEREAWRLDGRRVVVDKERVKGST